MKHRKTMILIGVLILVITPFVLFTLNPRAQDRTQQQEVDPPTPVQPGVMSEKQRKHSKIIPTARNRRNLLERQGDVEEIVNIHSGSNFGGKTPPTKVEYFQKLACLADLVVVAKIISKDSQLTENQDFVFTDYELEVAQTLKNNSNTDIQSSSNITLTTPGGSVTTGGRRITIFLTRKFPLRVRGEYLFFLKYVPDAETYKLINERGIFGVLNNKVITPENASIEEADSIEATANLIRGVANNCSNSGVINHETYFSPESISDAFCRLFFVSHILY